MWPSRTISGLGCSNWRTTQGSSPSPTKRLDPPPRNRWGIPPESSRSRRLAIDSCFLMRKRSVVPPMPSEVRSASEARRRSSTPSSASAATMLASSMRMGSRVLGSEQNHQLVAGAAYVAGPDGENGVERARFPQQVLNTFLHGANVRDILVSGLTNGIGQSFAGDPGNRRLACGIDVGEHQHIGLVKGA